MVLVGPHARDILQKVTDADLSSDAFKWLTGQRINVGLAPDVRALRVNFVGELGWELHHPIEYQSHIFDALVAAGAEFELGMCGMRAMDSLRIEKSYRMWGQDLTRECSVFEAGLERFVHLDKGDFIGRGALLKQQQEGVPQAFVTLEVDADDADPLGNEPLYQGGAMIGRATAGAYGHVVGKSLAIGYVSPDAAAPGTALEIEILGERRAARVIPDSPGIRKTPGCGPEGRGDDTARARWCYRPTGGARRKPDQAARPNHPAHAAGRNHGHGSGRDH